MAIIGIVLGVVAIGLFIWLRKEQQMDNGLHAAEVDHIHQGMNALMSDFNHYQVKTDRKIAELEKQLEIKTKQTINNIDDFYRLAQDHMNPIITEDVTYNFYRYKAYHGCLYEPWYVWQHNVYYGARYADLEEE